MAQTWRDLLFAHWALPSEAVARIVPPALTLDTFDDRAWIGVTPFEVSGLRPRGAPPMPRLSRFPELNVRTYVSRAGKPGIFFLSLDAASPLAVLVARRSYRLPYFRARMRIERADGEIRYACERASRDGEPAGFAREYQPSGTPFPSEPGSLEYFPDRALLPVHGRRGGTSAARGDPAPAVAASFRVRDHPREHDDATMAHRPAC